MEFSCCCRPELDGVKPVEPHLWMVRSLECPKFAELRFVVGRILVVPSTPILTFLCGLEIGSTTFVKLKFVTCRSLAVPSSPIVAFGWFEA